MDPLSQRLFGKRNVTVTFASPKKDVEAAARTLFGKMPTKREFAELVGAPDGAKVSVQWYGDDVLGIFTTHRLYETDQARLVRREQGAVVVENARFRATKNAPKGFGTRIFARQVEGSRRLGVLAFLAHAAGGPGNPDWNGYYTWPRLGYNVELTEEQRAAAGYAGFAGVDDTIDLFERPGGPEWWRENGDTCDGVFILSEDSRSSVALRAYLLRNQVKVND